MPNELERLQLQRIKDAFSTSEASIAETFALIRKLRNDIIARLADTSPDSFMGAVLTTLDAELEDLRRDFEIHFAAVLGKLKDQAWEQGKDLAVAITVIPEIRNSLIGTGFGQIASDALLAAKAITADEVRNVSALIKSQITTEVQRVALGGGRPDEAISAIRDLLELPSTPRLIRGPMRGNQGIPFRAEMILRTEHGKLFNTANNLSLQQSMARIPMRKRWRTNLDGRERPSHRAMHNQVSDEKGFFTLAGVKALGPHDPRLPAREKIGCRCVALAQIDVVAFRKHEQELLDAGAARLRLQGF